MIRYIVLVYVRLEDTRDPFEPWLITVIARDDRSAIEVARAEAKERGLEVRKARIAVREPR